MAGKHVVNVSRVIPAPSEAVWAVVNDTSRYAEWVPQTLEVTHSDGNAGVGGTYNERNKVFGPIKGDSRWRIVEASEGHRLDEGEGLPLVKNVTFRIETQAAGESTEVAVTIAYDTTLGPIGALINKLAYKQVVAEQTEALANLEELVIRERVAVQEGQVAL